MSLRDQSDLSFINDDEEPADVIVADYDQGLLLIAETKAKELVARKPPKVLIVTPRANEWEICTALELGARGYLIQGCELSELISGVRAVHHGLRHLCGPAARRLADSIAYATLTRREMEVLRLVAEGLGNKSIARELVIEVGTVKSHLKTIFDKLGAKSRTELASVAKHPGSARSFRRARRTPLVRPHRSATAADCLPPSVA